MPSLLTTYSALSTMSSGCHPWQTLKVSDLEKATSPTDEGLIAPGTRIVLDSSVSLLDRNYIMGGSPWKLLKLAGAARSSIEQWRDQGVVGPGQGRLARTLTNQGFVHPRFESDLSLRDVDVVIPVKNDVSSLRVLLGQLSGANVTVVDDASTNPVLIREVAAAFGANFMQLPKNLGPAGARNAGARATTREFIWFIDMDVTIDDVLGVAQRLLSTFVDPLVSVSAPRVRGSGGSGLRNHFELSFSPLDMGPESALVVPGARVGYLPSACMMVRRSAFGDGFDESLRVGEDVDFVWRQSDAGHLVRYEADVVVTHRARTNWKAWWRQRVSYGESSAALANKHGDRLTPLRADRWTFASWVAFLFGQPLIGSRVIRVAREQLKERLSEDTDDRDAVASAVVTKGIMGAGGPLARSAVRTFGPLLLLLALHPKLRRRALMVYAIGTLWRWRGTKFSPADLPLAMADDAAYSVGVVRGAIKQKNLTPLTPTITKSTIGLRDVLGLEKPSN
jgi:mycofactocin glycosyltransferase